MGIEIYDFYIDDGYSGGNFDRPGFNRMIQDIEAGLINCVITKDISRLGREHYGTNRYIFQYFPEKNVRYIALLDNYDSLYPTATEDYIPFITATNAIHLSHTSRKIISVRHRQMEEGKFVSGTPSYGYKRGLEKYSLVVDDFSKNIVKRIFKDFLNGKNPFAIAKELTAEGIDTPTTYSGRKPNHEKSKNIWSETSVKTILTNELYIGTLIQGKYKSLKSNKKKKVLLPKKYWIVAKNAVEPIMDTYSFLKVQKILKKKSKNRNRIYEYMLKGLVYCADCGEAMTVRKVYRKNKYKETVDRAVYCCCTYATSNGKKCSMHYFREEELNEILLEKLRTLLTNNSDNERLNLKYEDILFRNNILEEYENELIECREKITLIDQALVELYKDRNLEILTVDDFNLMKEELENDKIEINEKIEDLKIMLESASGELNDSEFRESLISGFLKMKEPPYHILNELINKIEITEDKQVKIYFNFNITRPIVNEDFDDEDFDDEDYDDEEDSEAGYYEIGRRMYEYYGDELDEECGPDAGLDRL